MILNEKKIPSDRVNHSVDTKNAFDSNALKQRRLAGETLRVVPSLPKTVNGYQQRDTQEQAVERAMRETG